MAAKRASLVPRDLVLVAVSSRLNVGEVRDELDSKPSLGDDEPHPGDPAPTYVSLLLRDRPV